MEHKQTVDSDIELMLDATHRLRKRRNFKRIGAISGLVMGLAAAGYGTAAAASTSTPPTSSSTHSASAGPGGQNGPGPAPMPPRGTGESITAIGTNSITVATPNGMSTTYTTNSSTTYEKDGSGTTAASLAVGDNVIIQTSSPSSTVATSINIESPSIGGTVVSVGSTTIVVKDQVGFWRTIDLSGSTAYEYGGQAGSLSSVTTGENIVARGTVDSDHTSLDATQVDVQLPTISGVIKSVSGSTITLATRDNTTKTVTTTASTTYRTSSGTGTASSVTAGSLVIAEGTSSGDTITATSISILPEPSSSQSTARGAHPSGPPSVGGFGGFGGPSA